MTTTTFDSTMSSLGINKFGTKTPIVNKSDTSQQMDQADFLSLMTAQLKNQDPFNPVDNTQMVAQMAQLSQTSGIAEMNSTLKAIAERLGTTTATDAMAWVGKNVMVEGNVAYPNGEGGIQGAITLPSAAADVTVTISNANGETLRTVSLGAQDAGSYNYSWDGSTDSGNPAGSGPFTVKVSARGADGGAIAAKGMVWAPVTSVSIGSDGNAVLTLPGIGNVSASNVVQVG
jgi:flagellar basal-body rod modification protein FlgD